MATEPAADETRDLKLSDIETTWRRQHDPLRFTLVYGAAVQRYLLAMLQQWSAEQEADDLLQEILTQVTERGFPNYDPAQGKFRTYLKQVVRNAALKRVRQLASGARAAEREAL